MKRAIWLSLLSALLVLLTPSSAGARNTVWAPDAPLPQPINITCTGREADTVVVGWEDNATDETNYRIERRIGGGAWSEVATISPNAEGNYSAYTDTGADTSSPNRFYRVRSYRSGDDTFSPYSAVCNNRRIFEQDDFRIFYGLRGIDECPLRDGQEVCLADDNVSGQNQYVRLQADALNGSVSAFGRVGFTNDAGAPPGSLDLIPINVVWCDGGGCAGGGGLGISPLLMETPFDLNTRAGDPVAWIVALHEAFHFQQYKYPGLDDPAAKWVYEGQARSIQDKICIGGDTGTCESFDDIDTGYAGYVPEIKGYLGNPNRPINQTDYQSVLFWTYLAEKFGTNNPGPAVEKGMNLLVKFWEAANSSPGKDGIGALNDALAGLGHSERFRDIWKDFAVANYAKDLSGPGVPAKYQYEDMAETGGSYGPVSLSLDESLTTTSSFLDTDETVQPWGARYYELRPQAGVPIVDIQITQDSSVPVYYTVLGIKGTDLAYEFNQESRHLDHTLINDGYDKVVIVVAGLESMANYRYSFNGTEPQLRILAPTTANKARVGDPAAPDKFLVQVEVLNAEGVPLEGVNLDSFNFQIGDQNVPAGNILTKATVMGQHWFVLRAVTQAAASTYDFTATYGSGLSDTQIDAVNYVPRTDADSVLVIDRSGSMIDNDKMETAKRAARLYVDSWRNGDKLGLVSFNSNPTTNLTLRDWTTSPSGGSRQQALDAVDGLTATGGTAIGDALRDGWDELIARGDNSHDWALVLLSDGMETAGTETFDAVIQALVDNTGKTPVVHAVAVGPDADRPRMQTAASRTGGTYQFVSVPGAIVSAETQAIASFQLNMDARYRAIATEIDGNQQAYSFVGPLNDGNDISDMVTIPVENGAAELVLSLSWETGTWGFGTIQLRNPDGVLVSPTLSDSRHRVWRVSNPMGGEWTLFLQTVIPGLAEEENAASQTAEFLPPYLIQTALKSEVTMDVYLATPVEERKAGRPMEIVASLTDTGPLTGASVIASVERPAGGIVNVTLFDDGNHGDGAVNDGLYANRFYQTGRNGSYNVTVNASGSSPLSGPFTRQALLSFHIDSPQDTDGDGLPDDWEIFFDTDPNVNDVLLDPDNDDSNNGQEWQRGTDPNDSDTDDGGEADGTDADPLDPSDDGIEPTWGVAYPGDEKVVVKFVNRPEYEYVGFFRGSDPEGPFNFHEQVHFPISGHYTDTMVTNDTQYCYIVLALDTVGRRSAALSPTCATPSADPLPPHGWVRINDGARVTSTPDVILDLWASDSVDPHNEAAEVILPPEDSASGVTEMMISNDPQFAGASWEAYTTTRDWTLGQDSGLAAVYVKYRDAAGNESDVSVATIHVGEGPGMSKMYFPAIVFNR